MSELWIITAVVFVAVVLGVEAVYWLVSHSWHTSKSISRRLALGRELTSRAAVLNALRAERSFFAGKHPLLRRLNDRLAQTGLRLDRHLLLVWLTALLVVSFLVWSFIFGACLASAAAAVLSTLCLAVLVLQLVRRTRVARFSAL